MPTEPRLTSAGNTDLASQIRKAADSDKRDELLYLISEGVARLLEKLDDYDA